MTDTLPSLRVPSGPYPGLRPFLNHEAALLFGRSAQIDEVIARLRETQFVAVIGGSGCGKSSLVHAGVVPSLRSFAIPGTGDLWLPLTWTPGTNLAGSGADPQTHSPIGRFARKFDELLTPLADEAARRRRERHIGDLFRQSGGFTRLIDAYGPQLRIHDGLSSDDVCLLFVVDQFEELFHPSNEGIEDCRLLVERIIDHFYNPHPRCYVVLTMRSEHLSDCAGHLELPDAINKASYLVRRLSEDELKQAMVRPAERYLRLLERSGEHGLPPRVTFDDEVIERLLRDVSRIAHDPDHLPLLQHLLARLWDAARGRSGSAAALAPAEITMTDLARAALASEHNGAAVLPPDANTLEICLENWATALYEQRDDNDKRRVQQVLRLLAYRDPNTGLYTQQRLDVDAYIRTHRPDLTRALMRERLREDGLIGGVDYLFWDEDSPERATLKVSHEALIRRWSRFRDVVGGEAALVSQYVDLLRSCAQWTQAAPSRRLSCLLGRDRMAAVEDGELPGALADPLRQAAWRPVLALYRDHAALMPYAERIDAYLRASRAELRRRQFRSTAFRTAVAIAVLAAVVIVHSIGFTLLVQKPVLKRVEFFANAARLAQAEPERTTFKSVDGGLPRLKTLRDAVRSLDDARRPELVAKTRDLFGNPLIATGVQQRLLAMAEENAEQIVNTRLRGQLQTMVWPDRAAAPDGPGRKAERRDNASCLLDENFTVPDNRQRKTLLLPAAGTTREPVRPALFVVETSSTYGDSLEVFTANFAEAEGRCFGAKPLVSFPGFTEPVLAVDADLRLLVVALEGALRIYDLGWDYESTRGRWTPLQRIPTQINNAAAVDSVRGLSRGDRTVTLATQAYSGGGTVSLTGQDWHYFSSWGKDLSQETAWNDAIALQPAAAGGACAQLARKLGQAAAAAPSDDDRPPLMLEVADAGYCFQIRFTAGNPQQPVQTNPRQVLPYWRNGGQPEQQANLVVSIYARPDEGIDTEQAGQIRLTPVSTFVWPVGGDSATRRFYLSRDPAYAGWLASRRIEDSALIGLPWSTRALDTIAATLQAEPRNDQVAAATSR